MNQKKCPKCGELNPPEAVMCWACYTPLTGAGASATGGPAAGGRAVAAAAADEDVKKSAATPAQMGVIGVALLVGVLYGGYALFGGGNNTTYSGDTSGQQTTTQEFGDQSFPTNPTTQSGSGGGVAPPPPVGKGFGPNDPPTPTTAFSVVASPSPTFKRGTMGILSPNSNLSQAQAIDLARKANQQVANKWQPLTIYVFSDNGAAQAFKEYQSNRSNKPLDKDDYGQLTGVWSRTVLYYQFANGREIVQNPSSNSAGWWTRMGSGGRRT